MSENLPALNIKPSATSYKSYARFNFEKAELSGLKPDVIVQNLQKLDTNIEWENFKDLSVEQTYQSLKNTDFNVNLNNPNLGLESLLSKEANQYRALDKLKAYEKEEQEKSLTDKGKDIASDILSGVIGYDNARYRAKQEKGKEVFNTLIKAGIDSKELEKRDVSAPALSNVLYNERGTLNLAKDILLNNNGAKEELDNAVKAYELFKANKPLKSLGKEEKEIVDNKLGFFSTLFKDEGEKYAQFQNLVRAEELSSNAIKAVRMLENVLPSKQFLRDLWSSESLSEKQTQALKDYEVVAKEFGFDAIAYNESGLYFVKDGKVFAVDENFNDFLIDVIKDNKGSLALGIAGAMQGAKKGVGGAIAGGAIGGFAGGAIDSILTDLYFENKDFSIAQALLHGAQEAGFNIAGDLVFQGVGAVVKGVKNASFTKILPSDTKEQAGNILSKVSETLSGQNIGAIDRVLNAQTKSAQKKANTKAFLQSQSDIRIQDEFKEPTIIKNIITKLKDKLPLNVIDNTAQKNAGIRYKRSELLANVLRNKDLSDSLAGQLDDVEARILSQALDKMANDFKAVSKDYEKLVAKEVLENEANPSLPKIFQKAVKDAEDLAKNQYKKATAELEEALAGEKLDLLSPFKKMADIAIEDFGANSDIAKVLINEVKNLEGRNITIKEALEKRKDINQILRNFNDNPNTLKKFRIDDSMNALKEAIDTTISNAIEKKIARIRLNAQQTQKAQTSQAQEGGGLFDTARATTMREDFLKEPLSAGEIESIILKWDLSAQTQAASKQRLIIAQIDEKEAALLKTEFGFKDKKPLVREIDSHQILHTLKKQGEQNIESARGQEAITLKDISEYQNIIKEADLRITQDNRILYAKQINGHFIVIEEVLEGQDKLRFFNMWRQKGKLNKEVLLSHSVTPQTRNPSLNLGGSNSTKANFNTDSLTKQDFNPLESLNAQNITRRGLDSNQIQELLARFDNVQNLKQHLNTRADSHVREGLFDLLDTTIKNPHIQYVTDNKTKYLKKFKDEGNKSDPYFYLLVTKDKDKTFITHLKTRDLQYLQRELLKAEEIQKGAHIIGELRVQAGGDLLAKNPLESPTSNLNSKHITKTNIRQGSEQGASQRINKQGAGYQVRDGSITQDLLMREDFPINVDFGTNYADYRKGESFKSIDSKGFTKEETLSFNPKESIAQQELMRKEYELRALLTNFKEANSAYADIKKRLNDKLTKAIFMDKPKKSTINSMRSVEEWKKAVLDKRWVESIQGLENTIFAKFNPRMQEATQTLMIFRSLERHIKESEGYMSINLSKALKDIGSLEALPLHPKAQNALNIFKELAQVYQFAQKISGAKGFKSGAGNGALSTTLEGRAKVFLTNKLFKNLFFRIPYIGDKDAVLYHLKKAVRDLKYPRAITLDLLDNPPLSAPSPKSPLNPKGEAFINDEIKRDISEFASNESVLKDEFLHKRAEMESLNIEHLSPSEVLQALEDGRVLYSKVGAGSIKDEDLKEIKSVLKELERGEGIKAEIAENANALITTKESIDKNKNRIYSIELELTPRFNNETSPLEKLNINQGHSLLTQATRDKDKPLASIAKNDKGDFSPKIFNMQEVNIDGFENFMYYAKLVGFDLKDRKDAKEIHKALLAQKDALEC